MVKKKTDATPNQNLKAIANLAEDVQTLLKHYDYVQRLIKGVDIKCDLALAAAKSRDSAAKIEKTLDGFRKEIKETTALAELPKNSTAALRRIANEMARLSSSIENHLAENHYE